MNALISSKATSVHIQLLDESFDKFNSFKNDLGYDFFEIRESKISISFSHFDFFLNIYYIIRLIQSYKIQIDSTFKDLIDNIKQNKFFTESLVVSEDTVLSSISKYFKRELKPFQIKNVQKLVSLKSGATFSVPGAGKTSEILATYSYFKSIDISLKLLVICPKNAVSAWDEEIENCLKFSGNYNKNIVDSEDNSFQGQMAFISGGVENANFILSQNPDLSIITFDSNSIYLDKVANFVSNNNVMCAVDESHRIKGFPRINNKGDIKGSRCLSVLNLSGLFKHKFIMSGTPMPQDSNDLKSQFGFLFPERLSKKSFFGDLKSIFVRTTKKDIGLKPFNSIYKDIEMSNDHRELYEAIKNYQKRKFQSRRDQFTLKKLKKCIMYLLQVSSNPRIVDDKEFLETVRNMGLEKLITESSEKFNAVCALVDELTSKGEKVLIWTSFKKNVELLESELSHLKPVKIDGSVGAGEVDEIGSRKFNIAKFKNDPNCMVFIANPAAASEGISLHIDKEGNKLCSNAIYLDRNFNSSQFLQSVDRIHRIGSKETPNIYIFRTVRSIDMRVQRRLDEKVSEMMKLLDDPSLLPYINTDEFYPNYNEDKESLVTNEEANFYYSYLNDD